MSKKVRKELIAIIIASTLFSTSCLASGTLQRSPTPGFGFSTKTYEYDEGSLEYQMEMAFLIRNREERYKIVEELIMEHWNKQISENKKSKKGKSK